MKEHKQQAAIRRRCDPDVQRQAWCDRRPPLGAPRAESVEGLLVDPHQGPRLVGLALVIDAAELVAELAVLPLVVVVVFDLPHRLKRARLVELHRESRTESSVVLTRLTRTSGSDSPADRKPP